MLIQRLTIQTLNGISATGCVGGVLIVLGAAYSKSPGGCLIHCYAHYTGLLHWYVMVLSFSYKIGNGRKVQPDLT